MDIEEIKKCDAALISAAEVLGRMTGRGEYFDKLCRAKFVIGWLKQALVTQGMSNEEAEAEIGKAEAEHVRIFGEVSR